MPFSDKKLDDAIEDTEAKIIYLKRNTEKSGQAAPDMLCQLEKHLDWLAGVRERRAAAL